MMSLETDRSATLWKACRRLFCVRAGEKMTALSLMPGKSSSAALEAALAVGATNNREPRWAKASRTRLLYVRHLSSEGAVSTVTDPSLVSFWFEGVNG